VLRQSRRTFADRLDFVTSVGFGAGADSRRQLGLTGGGPTLVITDLGVLRPDPESRQLGLTGIYPGISVDQVRDSTGWELAVSPDLSELAPPSAAELAALRLLLASTSARSSSSSPALSPPAGGGTS
jgi:glutaconate CoA-transferase subunit B